MNFKLFIETSKTKKFVTYKGKKNNSKKTSKILLYLARVKGI